MKIEEFTIVVFLCRQFEFWYEVFFLYKSSSIKHVFLAMVEGRKMTDITN